MVSGDFTGWNFFVSNAEGLIAAQVRFGGLGFALIGRGADGQFTEARSTNVKFVQGHWYHFSVMVSPPSAPESQHTMWFTVSDLTAGTTELVPNAGTPAVYFFHSGLTAGMNVFQVSTNGQSGTYRSELHLDNVRVNKADAGDFRYSYFPSKNALRYWLNLPKGPPAMNVTGIGRCRSSMAAPRTPLQPAREYSPVVARR